MPDPRAQRWLSLEGDGATKLSDANLPEPRRVAGGVGQPRNERISVSAISRVMTRTHTRVVRIVGLSATTALVVSPEGLGHVGDVVELFLPVVGNRELRVTAGVVSADEVKQGQAVLLHLMIAEASLRRQLNELIALLLAGDGDAARKQPSVIYDVQVRYGARAERVGHLEALSPSDLSLRVVERIPNGAPLRLSIPGLDGGAVVVVEGQVTGQSLSREGGYHTAIALVGLTDERRRALSALIADLMCR